MTTTPRSAEVQLAELFWRHEAEGVPALKAVRDQHSFTDQSETTQAKWLGYARVALRFRLTAKPAEEGVRAATIEECAKAAKNFDCEYQNAPSTKAGIIDAIRALSTTGAPEQ